MKTLYENEEKNRDSSMFENPGEVEKNFITQINKYMENEYEKMSFLALEKERESATLEYIESLLQTKEGIRNLLYRIQNITEMDNSFSNIDDTVMFFYDKVNQDICKKQYLKNIMGYRQFSFILGYLHQYKKFRKKKLSILYH